MVAIITAIASVPFTYCVGKYVEEHNWYERFKSWYEHQSCCSWEEETSFTEEMRQGVREEENPLLGDSNSQAP